MTNDIKTFTYEKLDKSTAKFLRTKENNMREIIGKAYTDTGRELYEAQQALSNNGNGIFLQWLDHVGIQRRQATRLIQRYKLIIGTNCPDIIEELPVSLSYEIAKPSADSTPEKAQAKDEVMRGEINTLNEYRLRISALEMQNDVEQSERERLKEENERLAKELKELKSGSNQDNSQQDRLMKDTHGLQLLNEFYKAADAADDWHKQFAWLTHDENNLRDYVRMDGDLLNEYQKMRKMFEVLDGIFYGDGNSRTIIEILDN